VNFGVEGAHTRSVLWRLQHGELDGYKAKVFVLTALGIADVYNHHRTVNDAIAGMPPSLRRFASVSRKRRFRSTVFRVGRGRRPARK
jgi:hypothetical protein